MVRSQWDFGELFPPETGRKILSVSELTAHVRQLLERHLGTVWVSGEITNLRTQSSGHIYFTLKDPGAQLNCVLFRSEPVMNRSLLADGRKVLVQGEVTVYEARGQYQLIVHAVELQGVGVLQIRFEQLKQRLAAEGLFAPERKRPLPEFPQRIGLVTSPTGAAIRDVLHVIRRRNPSLEIVFVPCRVQGEGAAGEIAAAIRLLNEYQATPRFSGATLDLILVTRGGGSLEDLWAFNEEVVARAIFESAVPVVSAVGHEIDFTIADFVADVRAATPSAAAEIITEGVFASRDRVREAPRRLQQIVRRRWREEMEACASLAARLARLHPRRRMNEMLQRLDDLQSGLQRGGRRGVRERLAAYDHWALRLGQIRPRQLLERRAEMFETAQRRVRELTQNRFKEWRTRLTAAEARRRLLGPEQVLARGYSITMDAASGAVLRDAAQIQPGQKLKTRLACGEIFSEARPADL